jgi:hypothetical protein
MNYRIADFENTEAYRKSSLNKNTVKFEEQLFPSTSSSLTDFLNEKGEDFDENHVSFSRRSSFSKPDDQVNQSIHCGKETLLKEVTLKYVKFKFFSLLFWL